MLLESSTLYRCRKLWSYLDAVLCVFANPILTLGSKQLGLPIELFRPESISSRYEIPSLLLAINRNSRKVITQNRQIIKTFAYFLGTPNIFDGEDFQLICR